MHDLIARCSSSFVPRGLHLELAKRGTYLVVFCHVVCTAFSTDIVVGGEVGWAQTDKFDDIDALKGDRLVSLMPLHCSGLSIPCQQILSSLVTSVGVRL